MNDPIVQYENLFSAKPYVRGKASSDFALEASVLAMGNSVLDLGCGEGQDAVTFAEKGYCVTAIDASTSAIAHAKRLAAERGLQIRWICDNIQSFSCWDGQYDFIYADGLLHFFEADKLSEVIGKMQERTKLAGINAIGVFDNRTTEKEKADLSFWGIKFESIPLIELLYSNWSIVRKDFIISERDNGERRGIAHFIFKKTDVCT